MAKSPACSRDALSRRGRWDGPSTSVRMACPGTGSSMLPVAVPPISSDTTHPDYKGLCSSWKEWSLGPMKHWISKDIDGLPVPSQNSSSTQLAHCEIKC